MHAAAASEIEVIGSGDAFHSESRAHTSFLVRSPSGTLLIDAGASTPLRLCQSGRDPDSIDALLLTHFHGDHLLGLPILLVQMQFASGRRSPLRIAGPAGVEAACRTLLDASYPGMTLDFGLEFVELRADEAELAGLRIDPVPVTHRPESLGYRIRFPSGRVVAFSGDAAFDGRLVELVAGADLAFVETSIMVQVEPPVAHVSAEEIALRRGELKADRLVFTHLGPGVAASLRASSHGTPAWDGMVVSV